MAIKQYVSLNEPLFGIGTYKDTLNLDTGATTRKIKKLVLTGSVDENITLYTIATGNLFRIELPSLRIQGQFALAGKCSHYRPVILASDRVDGTISGGDASSVQGVVDIVDNYASVEDFKSYLAAQYAAGTPVTVWYVLSTPTTSTTALPRGLSGIVEGFLTQSGTPTPTNPIYPTANSIDAFLDKKYLKFGTETDTITTLPKTIIGDGQSASAVIKGNMQQSGTPTPTNPIYPAETGDKTANLFDGTTSATNKRLSISTGGTYSADGYSVSEYIPILPSTRYIVNTSYSVYYCLYDANRNYIMGDYINNVRPIANSYSNAAYIRFDFATADISTIVFVQGSTAPTEYIPYGYKIPILSGGTTTPVYLGEVESTRKVKKFVLNGTEDWVMRTVQNKTTFTYTPNITLPTGAYCICSHYKSEYSLNNFVTNLGSNMISMVDNRFATADDFKNWLASQYSSGTPVTAWVALVNSQTTVLNEPLRTIREYSDSVTGTGLPTTGTAEQFDVDTTLKPSEVDLTYHGWHPHSDTVFTE